jgi:hypothetical protein
LPYTLQKKNGQQLKMLANGIMKKGHAKQPVFWAAQPQLFHKAIIAKTEGRCKFILCGKDGLLGLRLEWLPQPQWAKEKPHF